MKSKKSTMTKRQKLEQLVSLLERSRNPDAERIKAAKAALTFFDSWIDLAMKLGHIRNVGAYESFGFCNFDEYATSELGLTTNITNKLLLSRRSIS